MGPDSESYEENQLLFHSSMLRMEAWRKQPGPENSINLFLFLSPINSQITWCKKSLQKHTRKYRDATLG